MTSYNVRVEPFSFLQLLRCDISKGINMHATAHLTGIISDENEDAYAENALKDTIVQIICFDTSGDETVVFSGLVEKLDIYSENGLKTLSARLISASKLMDMYEETRTFQDKAFSYSYLLDFIGKYKTYDYLMNVEEGKTIDKLVVQYKETDWEFAKRLASHFNSFVVPESTSGKVRYYFGMPKRRLQNSIDPIEYHIMKDLSEYIYKTKNGVQDLRESDAIYYIVNERQIRDIGEPVLFKNRSLYVYGIESRWVGQELQHFYTLKTENGFRQAYAYNPKIVGASLSGAITEVQYDNVQINTYVDPDPSKAGKQWFPYSTVYSSPDGTGWYAMPEPNDEIRLYFPTEKESQAYVISSTHLEVTETASPSGVVGPRTNPDYKSIKNKYDKEVLFTPTTLIMTNNKGMQITLDDEEGISIISDKKIVIHSDESVTTVSTQADINMIAQNQVVIKQSDAKIEMTEEKVLFSGAIVDIQ